MAHLRATIYYLGFYLVTIFYSIFCLLCAPLLSNRQRALMVSGINFFYIFWLRICCGLNVEIEGKEHLPKGAYVLVSNHSSEWETLYFLTLVRPICMVLKKELLKLPFFGWALALLRPVALDRSKRRDALKQLLEQGSERLNEGLPMLIFPQGTRVPLGKMGKFNKGGAMLAVETQLPLVPVVHNAALFWPGGSFVKKPGVVKVKVGPVINPQNLTLDEVHDKASSWLQAEMVEAGLVE